MDWLHRVARKIELALSVAYLCTFGCVLLFAITVGNTRPAPPPFANSGIGPAYEPPLTRSVAHGAALWQAVLVPSQCCATRPTGWRAQIVENKSR
jgi:hypothetical protein